MQVTCDEVESLVRGWWKTTTSQETDSAGVLINKCIQMNATRRAGTYLGHCHLTRRVASFRSGPGGIKLYSIRLRLSCSICLIALV